MSFINIKTLIISIFLFLSYLTKGQDIINRTYISTSVITPTIYLAPRLNIGVVQQISEKWLIGLDFEYGSYDLLLLKDQRNYTYIDKSYSSKAIRPHLYYVISSDAKIKKFVSLDMTFVRHTDALNSILKNNIRTYLHGEEYSYDQADYSRRKISLNLNYGLQANISKRFSVITYVGVGMKKRKVTYSNIQNPISEGIRSDAGIYISPDGFMENMGKHSTPSFNTDLKLLYKLGRLVTNEN